MTCNKHAATNRPSGKMAIDLYCATCPTNHKVNMTKALRPMENSCSDDVNKPAHTSSRLARQAATTDMEDGLTKSANPYGCKTDRHRLQVFDMKLCVFAPKLEPNTAETHQGKQKKSL